MKQKKDWWKMNNANLIDELNSDGDLNVDKDEIFYDGQWRPLIRAVIFSNGRRHAVTSSEIVEGTIVPTYCFPYSGEDLEVVNYAMQTIARIYIQSVAMIVYELPKPEYVQPELPLGNVVTVETGNDVDL